MKKKVVLVLSFGARRFSPRLWTYMTTKLTPEKIELASMTREKRKIQIKILPADLVDVLIKKYEKVEH